MTKQDRLKLEDLEHVLLNNTAKIEGLMRKIEECVKVMNESVKDFYAGLENADDKPDKQGNSQG